MARPPITGKSEALFRKQLDAALDYLEGAGGGSVDIDDIPGLQAALDGKQPLATVLTNTTASFTTALETKLNGIEAGAQVNVATDLSYTAATRVLASSTGTDATLPLVTSGDAGLAPASGGGTTNFLRADGTWAPAAGSALGLWDFWKEHYFYNTDAASSDIWIGGAISSGTNTTAIPAAALLGYNSHGVFLRSSTTANGGYRYQTTSIVADYFGGISHKFRGQFLWRTSFTGRLVSLGFQDSFTSTESTDGAYFLITADQCVGKTANNGARSSTAAVTLALDTAYTFDIEVNAAGTSARFRVYAGTSLTPVLDETLTTNIPTTSARAFGAGIVATESSTTASDIGILYSLGLGTVDGFTRARA